MDKKKTGPKIKYHDEYHKRHREASRRWYYKKRKEWLDIKEYSKSEE